MFAKPRGLMSFLLLMLLALPAAQASTTETLRMEELRSGELLMPTGNGDYQPATRLNTHARINITGPIARTRLTQTFRNDSDNWVEAIYAFPLPENAAVDHLRMHIGELIIEGVIQPKKQARHTYEKAKRAGKKAALLEQHRPNLFSTRVANIPPHGKVKVEIAYQQLLHWRDDHFSLRLPLAITPRYSPAPKTPVNHQISIKQGWSLLPGELPNVADTDAHPTGDNKVSIDLLLDAGFALQSVTSPSHAISKQATANGLHIQLANGQVVGDHDFRLVWTPQPEQAPQAAFFTEASDSGDYGLLMVMPPKQDASRRQQAREVIFVIDTSGSMSGVSIRAARAALLAGLDTLTSRDRFNVIEFDNDTNALFAAPRQATSSALQRARYYVRGLQANGGTEMYPALQMALGGNGEEVGQQHLRQVIFITDAGVGNEAQLLGLIHNQLGNSRLFMVGIGSAPNTHFMTEAAHFGRGTYTYIARPDEVDEKMSALFAQLSHPVLTGLKLNLPVTADVLPQPIPDLYLGEPLVLVMKLDGQPKSAVVTGSLGQRPWSTQLSLGQGKKQAGIGVLWARRKIQFWERANISGASDAKVKQAITSLAMQHHLVSRFTSLVAVEKTPSRPANERLDKQALKSALPAGMKVPMAQTGTASSLLLLLGLMTGLLGLALRFLLPKGDKK